MQKFRSTWSKWEMKKEKKNRTVRPDRGTVWVGNVVALRRTNFDDFCNQNHYYWSPSNVHSVIHLNWDFAWLCCWSNANCAVTVLVRKLSVGVQRIYIPEPFFCILFRSNHRFQYRSHDRVHLSDFCRFQLLSLFRSILKWNTKLVNFSGEWLRSEEEM